MSLAERVEAYAVGHISFPFTNYLFNRRRILSRYRELRESERLAPEKIRAIQLARLKQVVAYAFERVPFYAARFRTIGLVPGDITSLEDLKRIPALSRQEVIDHRLEMVDSAFLDSAALADHSKRGPAEPIPFAPFRRHRLVRNTSSGSTGAPTVFYEDGSRTALNWVHELRLKGWFGIPPGAREARMVRLSSDYLPHSRTLRLRNRLWNQLIVPGVNLTDEHYAVCAEKIRAFRPKVLWGFTSALAGFAGYLRRGNIDPSPWGIRLVVGWAAPVYEHERRILEEVFACPVSNNYGAREVGHVAGQCPQGTYHVNQEYLLAEQVEAAADGGAQSPGEILVTTLDISPMPFIRYRMGDIGRIAESTCGCGRKLQELRDFMGRTGEIFIARDGRMISPNFWCRTFMNPKLSNAVQRFQVIYVRDDLIRIMIQKGSTYGEASEEILRDHLGRNFPPDLKFEFDYVPEIKPQVSGKYQMVVNQMSRKGEA